MRPLEPTMEPTILVSLLLRWVLVPILRGRVRRVVWCLPSSSLPARLLSAAACGLLLGALALSTSAEAERADLVVLRENSLERPSPTRSIEWVMKDGALHRPADLLEGLVEADESSTEKP